MGRESSGLEEQVTNAVDQVPERWRSLFVEILSTRNAELLDALRSEPEPTPDEAQAAKRILQREFMRNVDSDSEPTPRGREIDDLTGDFIRRFVAR